MRRRSVITLAGGLALALPLALPLTLAGSAPALAQAPAIRGSAAYRERMALPPGAVLEVALLDISRADAPAETLADARIPIEGQVPVAFVLPYDPARILPNRSYALRGTIVLDGQPMFRTDTIHPVLTRGTGETVELRLVRATPASVGAMAGGEWVAEDIGGKGVLARVRTTLAFTAEGPEGGKVAGSGGCNRIAGSYTLAGETIRFGQMISSMMACAPAIGEQEARFMQVLGQAGRWRITPEGRLELLDPAGVRLARLARR